MNRPYFYNNDTRYNNCCNNEQENNCCEERNYDSCCEAGPQGPAGARGPDIARTGPDSFNLAHLVIIQVQ